MEVQNDEIDLRDVANVIKKRWAMILLPAVLVAAVVGISVNSMPKKYESYSLIRIGRVGGAPIESIPSINEIMNSLVMRKEVARKVKSENKYFINSLIGLVKYEESAGLLKIKAFGTAPDKANELAEAVTDMVLSRHEKLYANGQEDMDQVLKYVKTTVSPVPLSISINEIKIEPTRVEVAPIANAVPVKNKARIMGLAVFFAVILLNLLIAFYVEGKENKE